MDVRSLLTFMLIGLHTCVRGVIYKKHIIITFSYAFVSSMCRAQLCKRHYNKWKGAQPATERIPIQRIHLLFRIRPIGTSTRCIDNLQKEGHG